MKRSLRLVWISIAAVSLTWIGWSFQQRLQRQAEIKTKLEEAIGRDAGYTETILKMEQDSNNITYEEFFQLCDKSIEARTSLIVELRGLYPSINSTTKTQLIDFLNAENDTVRAKRDLYRKRLLFRNVMDIADAALKNVPSSAYGWSFYYDNLRTVKDNIDEAAKDLQSSGKTFVESYQRTFLAETHVTDVTAHSGIRFHPIFKQYNESNIETGRQAVTDGASFRKKT